MVVSVVLWCGVMWYGVVWCGAVRCGAVWCGVVWCEDWSHGNPCALMVGTQMVQTLHKMGW